MNYRTLGRTGWQVSEISFGAWAIGGDWGNVSEKDSMEALHTAVDMGINFFDTADVYGDGRSEKLIGKLKKERNEEIIIATKAGRRLNPHIAKGYNKKNLTEFVERSLKNLEVESLDLLQLHCPPTEVYYMPETFDALDDLVKVGKLKYYGVSVEKVEEALKAIEFPNVQSIQIIFNIFRQRPADLLFEQAKKHQVGILARVPLASGLLTGKFNKESKFESNDHRNYNKFGEAFDRGETFLGLDYNLGLEAVEKLKQICPENLNLAQFALKWILSFNSITCAIPGAKNIFQVKRNASISDLADLSSEIMRQIADIYEQQIKKNVHHYW
ncbi:MAG: aldo/keto reductase [Bacteroidetes bacterium]|nr:aldo/keto reductase [Bacteroidota bacterium]MBU1117088.1 aldo/keto reductase [Bacteroidota bacterium]MBU1797216.1 aldo/keto reductase [Bacteroidota bacterium]